MNTSIEQARVLIHKANRIVAFSGAGISTEAGIPDFRGKGGLWEDQKLMELMSAGGFRRDPAAFYRASLQTLPNIHRAEPTAAHRLVARLEAQGKLSAVVTQNIDGLHQAAGSQTVYEIHGNFRTGRCVDCRAAYEMAAFYDRIERGEIELPLCSECRSPIKPDVVLFGDLLPFDVWDRAVEASRSCDLMLVLGSSLIVYPAAELPKLAVMNGAKLIIVNREATDYDPMASAVIRGSLGDFALEVMKNL
ncbi:MAG TPA: NAD-dependent deacylase [Blastocatellia bacterium]|nr:NAD-dependent deacylase [Blastocatellia bacterium]